MRKCFTKAYSWATSPLHCNSIKISLLLFSLSFPWNHFQHQPFQNHYCPKSMYEPAYNKQWIKLFQPTQFCNLPHEKVYRYVFNSLNILAMLPVVVDYVHQYLFLPGKYIYPITSIPNYWVFHINWSIIHVKMRPAFLFQQIVFNNELDKKMQLIGQEIEFNVTFSQSHFIKSDFRAINI